MSQLIIVLPIPSKTLSPNARPHWAAKAKATEKARSDAHLSAMAAIREQGVRVPFRAARLQATFAFKVRRFRDDTNLRGWLKAYEDGIADAMKMDDRDFTWLPPLQRVDPLRQSVTIVVTELVPEKPADEPF